MIRLIQIRRLYAINRVLIKHGLDEVLLHIPVFSPLRFFYYIAPWNIKKKEHLEPLGVRIRLALEDLGPVFIKFGQMLSTRSDLLPPDINQELSKLQDNVPPFSSEQAITIIEKPLVSPSQKPSNTLMMHHSPLLPSHKYTQPPYGPMMKSL